MSLGLEDQAADLGLWWPEVKNGWRLAHNRVRDRATYAANPAKKATNARWRRANPEKVKARLDRWAAANPGPTRAHRHAINVDRRARLAERVYAWARLQGGCAWPGCDRRIGADDDVAELLKQHVFERDHADPATVPRSSSGKRRSMGGLSFPQLEADLENCQLLCTEHHVEKTTADKAAGRC